MSATYHDVRSRGRCGDRRTRCYGVACTWTKAKSLRAVQRSRKDHDDRAICQMVQQGQCNMCGNELVACARRDAARH